MKIRSFKPIIIFCFILSLSSTLCGCNKTIFVKNTDRFAQVELTKDELKNDKYYIKGGTRFVEVHKPNMGQTTDTDTNRARSLCFLRKDYKKVPTLYKGEIIAIASANTNISSINVIRYKEAGYTIGTYGMEYTSDGYLQGTLQNNVFKYSDLYTYLETNAKSNNIRISSINGEPITENILTTTRLICGLEKDASYQFDYYAGTYFSSGTALADIFALEEYEYYELKDGEDTKNGYIAFTMPKDAKSGWYMIENQGMFRYISDKKGNESEHMDMNQPYYDTDVTQEDVYSQKFSVTFDIRLLNVDVQLPYNSGSIEDETKITGKLVSPDGTTYDMTVNTETKMIECLLNEAMAGKWTIYIQPKELVLQDVKVISSENQQEITEEEHTITIDESASNVNFEITYEGTGKIYAILVNSDNTTCDFILNEKLHKLSYTAPYIDKGNYVIKVYHYTDTNVLTVDKTENSKTDNDIITITE